MNDKYSPRQLILDSLRLWWVLAIVTIIGGMVGYMVHHILPPIFQAKSTLSTYIDFQDITDVLLTEYDEDVTINTVQSVMLSNDVIGAVLKRVESEGIQLNYDSFMHQMSIQRRLTDFDLYYRAASPEVAQQVVNTWMEEGITRIKQLQAEGLLPPYLTVNLSSLAELPQEPTFALTNSFVLAGAVIGLIVGIILTSIIPPQKPKQKTSSGKLNKRVA